MAYQVLARKYRPQSFSEVIGQEHVTRTLRNAIEQGRIAHGYIFSGHRGIGKTTIARILAMCLNCRKFDQPTPDPCGVCESCTEIKTGSSVDVIEIDAATNRGIDEIRELREAARYRPARDRYKIYILDEAHQITDAAFNALLKTLEEPPPHIVFMMATTEPEDIPQTIRSRCQHFSFHAVSFGDITRQLTDVAKKEDIKADPEAIAVLAEAGDGSMRDALSIMDQAIACCGPEVSLSAELVRGLIGTVSTEVMEQLMGCVAENNSEQALRLIDGLMTQGQSPAHFAKQLVRFLRNCVVAKVAGNDTGLLQISADERARASRVAEKFSEEDLARFMQIALRTHSEIGYKQEQRFHLELGVLKMVHAQRLLPLEQILSDQPLQAAVSTTRVTPSSAPRAPECPAAPPSPFSSPSRTSSSPSPFESDRSRKTGSSGSGPQMSSAAAAAVAPETVAKVVATAAVVAAVQAAVEESAAPAPVAPPPAPVAADMVPSSADAPFDINALRDSVIETLEGSQQEMLATFIDTPEWSFESGELVIKVAKSQMMIDMSISAEAKKTISAALQKAAGRPVKFKVVGGGNASAAAQPSHRSPSRASAGSARSRAAEHPLVRYFQEKFNAEMRTVIDQQRDEQ
jgi:DNA polymerase-3 subunit gamma/tau